MSRCAGCGDRSASTMCPDCAGTTPAPFPARALSGAITRIGVLEIYDTGSHALPWGVRRAGDTHPILQASERAIALAFARDHAKEYGRV